MTFDEFRQSLNATEPPAGLTHALAGLWWDGKGDWKRAHESAQQDEGVEGSWVHAYLHRKEGDQGNAAYWYSRAGKPVSPEPLDTEWVSIVDGLLADQRDNAAAMTLSFEQALIDVWRQTLVGNAKTVELGPERFPVRSTPKRGLRQVDFMFEGKEIRGLEQNPQTKSRWAQLARSGKKVMQFLSEGRYLANVVDGKVNFYGGRVGRLAS